MLITLYTPVGIEYKKININEYDIIYGDLIKYINLPKNELYDELDESIIIYDKVFIKTIINLFSYNQINSKEGNGLAETMSSFMQTAVPLLNTLPLNFGVDLLQKFRNNKKVEK